MKPENWHKRNRYHVQGNVAYLIISHPLKGGTTTVRFDAEDIDKAQRRLWRIMTGRGGDYCATGSGANTLPLSRYLMDTPEDEACDFISCDTLDCRKENLRNVEPWRVQKDTVRSAPLGQRSDVPYISYDNRSSKCPNRWIARAVVNGVLTHIGRYPTMEAAKTAQKKFLRELAKKGKK